MAYFPLLFRCTVQRASTNTTRSGQKEKTYANVITDLKCLYLSTSGNRQTGPQEGHQSVMAFYTLPGTDLREGDLILDITDKSGNIVEAGPFYAESVKKVPSAITGKVHHISCKLKGEA